MVVMIFDFILNKFFMRRKKRAAPEVEDEIPHIAPNLEQYMWGELRKLLRQHSPYSTSDISKLSQKKFR
jgi:hypothetical protein